MASPNKDAAELDMNGELSAQETCAQLEKILASPAFAGRVRSSQFLRFAVEIALQGRGAELKEYRVATEVLGKDGSFDPRLDPIVRTEASRLRSRLSEYYLTQGTSDAVVISLPRGTYVPQFARRNPRTPRSRLAWIGVSGALAAALAVLFASASNVESPPELVLTRLTHGAGLTADPAVSKDGKLVVYSSDRDGGFLDLWLQQLTPGGDAVRLTHDAADDTDPDFSPDGSGIVFRSERAGGGIFTIPSVGGESVRLAAEGFDPRYSPDGKRIAYWTRGRAGVKIIDAMGGMPKAVDVSPLQTAATPIWSPDGSSLLVYGTTDPSVECSAASFDWWVVPVSPGISRPTRMLDVFRDEGHVVMYRRAPHVTSWREDSLLVTARLGDSVNIWQVPFNGGKNIGRPVRLTSGTGIDSSPSMQADGTLVYASLTGRSNLWSLPVLADEGTVTGELRRLTNQASNEDYGAISTDGNQLAYVSNRSGPDRVYLKDLRTGRERILSNSPLSQWRPRFSRDGSAIAFGEEGKIKIVWPGQDPMPTAEKDGPIPWDFSPDGSHLLYHKSSGPAPGVYAAAIASSDEYLLLPRDRYAIFQAGYSPDGKWVAFEAFTQTAKSYLFAARLDGRRAIPEDEWVRIDPDEAWADKPRWSPNGNIIYYISTRDGFRCVWGQRLNPNTKRPLGEPFAMAHLHDVRFSMKHIDWPSIELSVTANRLVFNVGEMSGNLWLARKK